MTVSFDGFLTSSPTSCLWNSTQVVWKVWYKWRLVKEAYENSTSFLVGQTAALLAPTPLMRPLVLATLIVRRILEWLKAVATFFHQQKKLVYTFTAVFVTSRTEAQKHLSHLFQRIIKYLVALWELFIATLKSLDPFFIPYDEQAAYLFVNAKAIWNTWQKRFHHLPEFWQSQRIALEKLQNVWNFLGFNPTTNFVDGKEILSNVSTLPSFFLTNVKKSRKEPVFYN